MRPANASYTVPAIVLAMTGTGMATVRALAENGVDVHVFIFRREDSVNYSRYGRKVRLYGMEKDDGALLSFLIDYSKKIGRRPVVLPTSDAHALLLARHHDQLLEYCRTATTTYQQLNSIVSKDELYKLAAIADVPLIPAIQCPTLAEASAWSLEHSPPYFLKPAYEGIKSCSLRSKNLVLHSREDLINYLTQYGSDSLVVQRMLRGGDGYIFDCYGLCDVDGKIRTMASHRRWRQHPTDFGATCFGEIPSGLPAMQERSLYDNTEKLLRHVRYHGIFGIEWLHERDTDHFYLIDFNARPFSSIGHLNACGLNLPLLAYQELTGLLGDAVEFKPVLKQKYWVDFDKDSQTFKEKRAKNQLTTWVWLTSIVRCRSFAYSDCRDPMPGIHAMYKVLRHSFRYAGTRAAAFIAALLVPFDDLPW